MKTNSFLPLLVAALVMAFLCSVPAEARTPRVSSGHHGRGYGYRAPNVETRIRQWNRGGLIPSSRTNRTYAPIASPFSFGSDHSGVEVASGEVAISERDAIKIAQRNLRGLGFYRGLDDGVMNRSFEQALRKFQASTGARNTGVVDVQTLDALGVRVARVDR